MSEAEAQLFANGSTVRPYDSADNDEGALRLQPKTLHSRGRPMRAYQRTQTRKVWSGRRKTMVACP